MVENTNASEGLVKQLAFKNVNIVCQEIIQPHLKKETVSEFICLFFNVPLVHLQGLTIAAALKQALQSLSKKILPKAVF